MYDFEYLVSFKSQPLFNNICLAAATMLLTNVNTQKYYVN